jgi:VWFA-related protein
MKNRVLTAVLLWVSISSFAQRPAPRPSPSPAPASAAQQKITGDDDVVRITANLVQIDAVVTDRKGRQITDLNDQDFEILEDGRAQKITNLSYVSVKSPDAGPPSPAVDAAKDKVATPPVNLRPEQVHRTIALVVDDIGLSFESMVYVRQALTKFVDGQMQPGDLVAIIRTGAGTGALQQFTGDKRLLYAAIERIRWNPSGVARVGAFAPIDLDTFTRLRGRAAGSITGGAASIGGVDRPQTGGADRLEQFRKDLFSVGTLGALKFVVQGMRPMPGRKSVILMSDGISIFRSVGSGETELESRDPGATSVLEELRRLTDFAYRASVVIYTMDARGLQTLGLTAQENTDDLRDDRVLAGLANRRKEFLNSQNGLDYLAQQTGGFLIHDTNDLAGGITKVLDDQMGYYLIGYRPDDSTFNAGGQRSFHKLTVRVKRSGLKVRARTGFYGITDEEIRGAPQTSEQQMLDALTISR